MSAPAHSTRLALGAAALALATAAACQSPHRSLRVGSDAASLVVTMADLGASDHGNNAWVYEMSGCIATQDGVLGASDAVTFTSVAFKQGLDGCQFRVKELTANAGITFAPDSEPNVLYWTKDLTITEDPTGQLIASAPLQRLYEATPPADATKSFTLQVPVIFPAPDAGTPITGTLACSPDVANFGTYAAASPTTGVFTFVIPINQETPFACTWFYVDVAGDHLKYKGPFAGTSGQIDGLPAQTTKTTQVTLVLQQTTPPPATGTATATSSYVSVSTTGAGVCQDFINDTCVQATVPTATATSTATATVASTGTVTSTTTATGTNTTLSYDFGASGNGN